MGKSMSDKIKNSLIKQVRQRGWRASEEATGVTGISVVVLENISGGICGVAFSGNEIVADVTGSYNISSAWLDSIKSGDKYKGFVAKVQQTGTVLTGAFRTDNQFSFKFEKKYTEPFCEQKMGAAFIFANDLILHITTMLTDYYPMFRYVCDVDGYWVSGRGK